MKKYIWIIGILCISLIHRAQIGIQSKFYGTAQAGNKGTLEVQITRHTINSFAKYQLELPDGVSASEIDSKGGVFSTEKNKAKIVWINLPSEKTFSIKLKIYFNESVHFPVTLYQKFYYLEKSVKKEVSTEPIVLNESKQITIETKNESDTSPKESAASVTSIKPEQQETKTPTNKPLETQTMQRVQEEKQIPSVDKQSMRENYIYKIQIAASTTMPNKKEYAPLGKVEIIQHKGMYKVIIDKPFTTKEEALQYREQIIKKGYPGAFLVKYLNGQRVN